MLAEEYINTSERTVQTYGTTPRPRIRQLHTRQTLISKQRQRWAINRSCRKTVCIWENFHLQLTYLKINSRWIKDVNVKKSELSVLEENLSIQEVGIDTQGREFLSLSKIQNSGAITEKLDRFDNIKLPHSCAVKDAFKRRWRIKDIGGGAGYLQHRERRGNNRPVPGMPINPQGKDEQGNRKTGKDAKKKMKRSSWDYYEAPEKKLVLIHNFK